MAHKARNRRRSRQFVRPAAGALLVAFCAEAVKLVFALVESVMRLPRGLP